MSIETLPLMLVAVPSAAAVASILTYLVMEKGHKRAMDYFKIQTEEATDFRNKYKRELEQAERRLASARVLINKLYEQKLQSEKSMLDVIQSSEALEHEAFRYLFTTKPLNGPVTSAEPKVTGSHSEHIAGAMPCESELEPKIKPSIGTSRTRRRG